MKVRSALLTGKLRRIINYTPISVLFKLHIKENATNERKSNVTSKVSY
jgi:hypothetical protein